MQPHPVSRWFLAIPRPLKRVLALGLDAFFCGLTVWIALYLRLEAWVDLWGAYLPAVLGSIVLALPVFVRAGLYRTIFRHAGWHAMLILVRAMAVYGLLYAALFTLISVPGIPRTVGIIQPLLLFVSVGISRVAVRFLLGDLYRRVLKGADAPGVLIYGAGAAGRQLAAALARGTEHRLLGFLDDDERLHGNSLDGRNVYPPAALPSLIPNLGVTDLLLALPSVTHQRRLLVLESLRHLPVRVRTLPGMSDLAAGRVSLSDVRELDIEDLLGREPVTPDAMLLQRLVHDKVVLITGAGGSIGSELCRQIAACRPHTLLLVDNSEFALYQIHHELTALVGSQVDPLEAEENGEVTPMAVTLIPLLASVQDEERMAQIMLTWRPHTVYHAAAYKHVPLVEHNPVQGLRNNVWGTLVCALSARAAGVGHFVLISTDKAVRPTNIMGASKRMAEMVLQALAAETGSTTFSMVRFGNVLGSSGSVVPLFRQQIKDGGPITLTHPDITRYFMTIPEAAQLVIQAGAMAQGGDVFVLDMGQPVRIVDLAKRMVELSGLQVKTALNPTGDIEIETTGLRPGEKLFEELLIGDNPQPTQHPRILRAREDFQPWHDFQHTLDALGTALAAQDIPASRALLQRCVQGYRPTGDVVDWVHITTVRDAEPTAPQREHRA